MSEYKEQLIELFENVSGCSINEFSEEQLPYLADFIIGQQEADNMCIEKLKTENQRLTTIATKHAVRADELYEALDNLLGSTNKKLAGEDGSLYWATTVDEDFLNEAQKILDKSRKEAEE